MQKVLLMTISNLTSSLGKIMVDFRGKKKKGKSFKAQRLSFIYLFIWSNKKCSLWMLLFKMSQFLVIVTFDISSLCIPSCLATNQTRKSFGRIGVQSKVFCLLG